MDDLTPPGNAGAQAPMQLDAEAMAELRALDPDGHAQLVQRVLSTFRSSLARQLEQFARARAEGAWEQVQRIAHTLKSSSASIGAPAFASLCADLERALRTGDLAAGQALSDRFADEAARVDAAVARALGVPEASQP